MRNPGFGVYANDDEAGVGEFGSSGPADSHSYATDALSTLAVLSVDELEKRLRKARVVRIVREEIHDGARRWSEGAPIVLSERAAKAAARVASMLSLRVVVPVTVVQESEHACDVCGQKGCSGDRVPSMVGCVPCSGTGRMRTSVTRKELECANCQGRGKHPCQCVRCHA